MEQQKSLSEQMASDVRPKEQAPEQQGTFLPKILDMKVYFGLGPADDQGQRKPDPDKILFYEEPSGRVYDTSKHEWLPEKPAVCDHLGCRNINFNDKDIIAAIAHGVMEDSDYDALDKASMIGEMPKKLWQSMQQLKKQYEQLQMEQMAKADVEENGLGMSEDQDMAPEGHAESEDVEAPKDEGYMPGDDVISQIVQAAMADADDRIRQIVREEIAKLLDEGESEEQVEEEVSEIPEEDQNEPLQDFEKEE